MKTKITLLFLLSFLLFEGCSKSSTSTGPVYPVTATVLNPAGSPQGGAILKLAGKADDDPVFAAVTDSTGTATIKAPAGNQTLVAKMGSVFQTTFTVNVQSASQGTNAGTVKLAQNTALKVLVVQGDCEEIENVLRDPIIGFTAFDSVYVDTMNAMVDADSIKSLTYLQKYTLIFSDCDCGVEDNFGPLARLYGRYITNGGKIYGGHFNYYHLQKLFQPYYSKSDGQSPAVDSLYVTDSKLSSYLGFTVAEWVSADSRDLSGYGKFTDIPSKSKIYAVIRGTSPSVAVIVENYLGSGKYLWTDYHNQDVINASPRDPRLVKVVQYFLYSL